MYKVELTVLDRGALLTVVQSRHDHYPALEAKNNATAYAKRYGLTVEKITGPFWLIKDDSGRTQAQVAIR